MLLIYLSKNQSYYLIAQLYKIIRTLVWVLPKMSGFVKTFKLKDGDKNKHNETMFFRIDVEKLLEKYKTIED